MHYIYDSYIIGKGILTNSISKLTRDRLQVFKIYLML